MYWIFIWTFIPFLNILKEYSWLSFKIFIWIAPQHGIFFSIQRYSQRYTSDQLWLSWIFTWIFIFDSEYFPGYPGYSHEYSFLILNISWKRIFLIIFGYSWRPWPVAAVRPPRLLRYAAHRPPLSWILVCAFSSG